MRKKSSCFTGNTDRRLNNRDTAADRTDANLSERVTDFHGLLKEKYITEFHQVFLYHQVQ